MNQAKQSFLVSKSNNIDVNQNFNKLTKTNNYVKTKEGNLILIPQIQERSSSPA